MRGVRPNSSLYLKIFTRLELMGGRQGKGLSYGRIFGRIAHHIKPQSQSLAEFKRAAGDPFLSIMLLDYLL
jgi:hypothetical protein